MIPSLVSLVMSFLLPVAIEFVKNRTALAFQLGWVKAVFAAIVAAANVVGVSFALDGAAGTLLVSGLDQAKIVTLGVTFLFSWVIQEAVYRGAIKK